MADVRSHEDDVAATHPIGGREEGWEGVNGSRTGVASTSSDGTVTRSDRATNVYRKANGGWRVVHHHAEFAEMVVNRGA